LLRTRLLPKSLLTACLLLCAPVAAFAEEGGMQRIEACSDNSYWHPYLFVEVIKPEGLFVDILKEAGKQLGARVSVRPMSWNSCLELAQKGEVDLIAGASYSAERAGFLYYPADAASGGASAYRMAQVDYVVVTMANKPFEFTGNVRQLPQPVFVPKGYSVGNNLRSDGATVDDSSAGDMATLLRMTAMDKGGSAVMMRASAELLADHPSFSGKLKVHPQPYLSKSYFAAFSSKGRMDAAQQKAVWSAIAAVRDDQVLMQKLMSKYRSY